MSDSIDPAGVPLPDFKEFDGIGVDGRNRMRFMFARIPSDFSFQLPERSHTFLLYQYLNAFRATIEINNRIRSTCANILPCAHQAHRDLSGAKSTLFMSS